MDTTTHALAGVVIAMAVSKKTGRAGVAAVMAATLIPDADLVARVAVSSATYLEYHRVILNSLPSVVALSAVIALVARIFGSYRNFPALWGLCAVSMGLHAFMDLTNSYGAKPLWPWVDKWYALDWVFIIDPWIAGVLILAMVAMRYSAKRTAVLVACFLLLTGYYGTRAYMHARALDVFRLNYPGAFKVGAFPAPVSPFKWRMVAQERSYYWAGWYNLLDGEWEGIEMYPRTTPDRITRAAVEAPVARTFIEFARMPWITYRPDGDGWVVRIQDLRFGGIMGKDGFVATVRVHRDMTTDMGSFSFRPEDNEGNN